MDANELRIGNYVHDHLGRVQRVAETREDAYICYLSNGAKLKYRLNTTKPIPLSEEWLMKFGFIDFEKESFSYYIENNGEIVFKKSGLGILYDYPIQYAHQLQNLFFSLCGEELSLNKI